ncbi:MAG TPA: YceI family protein [Ktedonobacteraceae bacterium]|nr:YceI family protein [Ktedonobacteraceae bacterium]
MIWEIDPTHSQVSFAIRVLSVTTTRGSFNNVRGQLHIDEQNPASSWVEAEVDAASITTHNLLRDTHLRSTAFFAVKQYPTIAFKSTRVEHISGSVYQVRGNLTLLGRKKPVTFDVDYRGQSADFNARASLTARTTISRKDFGMGQRMTVRLAASETVTIEIALVAVQRAVRVPETVAIAE